MSYKYNNIAKAKAIEKENEQRLLRINPSLNHKSGIYFFVREDENGFKYAYIGQASSNDENPTGILTRLCQHMVGYQQRIDLSIRKHKLYDKERNPYGWRVGARNCPNSQLDELEQKYILEYANAGYQLRNVSLGGQGKGRDMISETKPAKTYRQGISQGRKSLANEIRHIIDLHLEINLKKPNNKVSIKALEKFNYLLNEETYKGE